MKPTDNSKQIHPGDLFISMPSTNAEKYFKDAIARGAAAIMLPKDSKINVPTGIQVIKSENIALDSARLADKHYPNAPKHICAITGTKGKTSTVSFVIQILKMLGKSAASIGTLGVVSDKWTESGLNTTPFAITLRQWMSRLSDNGVDYLAIEASSHGIDQHRIEFVKFDAVGFSNLSRDHLDYHKTMENYFSAKARLFSDFEFKTSVINLDDKYASRIPATISFGRTGSDMKIKNINPLSDGQEIEMDYFGNNIKAKTPLIGEFQIYNMLMAVGLVIGMGIKPSELPIRQIFLNLRAPAGRAEFVGKTHNGAMVYVDYAHTPASLEQIIKAMRKHTSTRLHILFGCGGDRDAGKRSMMGEIASKYADVVVITDDNPRTENADEIRQQIMNACPNAMEIANRRTAIRQAIKKLKSGEILVIAGKGHEDYQILGKKKTHFSDVEEAQKAIALTHPSGFFPTELSSTCR